MKLSIEEMRMLARKSRLALHDDELAEYAVDLDELERLSEALLPYGRENGGAVQASVGLSDLRTDEVRQGLTQAQCLELSPVCREEWIAVPRTVKE